MSINRIVVLLTPVFAGLAGFVCQWIAVHFPGTPALDQGEVTAIFIAGATAAATAALGWLHGWQKHEEAQAVADLNAGLQPGE
jgi:hypothetical protein